MYYDIEIELPQLLARTYLKYGLSSDEFIILNACIMQSVGQITVYGNIKM